jgi:hypothetical protein
MFSNILDVHFAFVFLPCKSVDHYDEKDISFLEEYFLRALERDLEWGSLTSFLTSWSQHLTPGSGIPERKSRSTYKD